MKTTRYIGLVTILLGGLLSCTTAPPPVDKEAMTRYHLILIEVLRGYQLPPTSLPSAGNADREIAAFIDCAQQIALDQGLLFDGRKSTNGFVMVGQPGDFGSMTVAVYVHRGTNGKLTIGDSFAWVANDAVKGQRMRDQFLSDLRKRLP